MKTNSPNRKPVTLSNEGEIVASIGGEKLPRIVPIKLSTLGEIRSELGRLYREARMGRIDTADASRLTYILGQLREMHLAMEIESRLLELERRTIK